MKIRMLAGLVAVLILAMGLFAAPGYAAGGDIASHPTDLSVALGESAVFSVAIVALSNDGTTVFYQWFRNSVNDNTSGNEIPGATSARMTVTPISAGESYYYCEVTLVDASGVKTALNRSNAAKLTVTGPAVEETAPATQPTAEAPTQPAADPTQPAADPTTDPTVAPTSPAVSTGPTARPTEYTALRRGSTGDAVVALQKRLILLGFLDDVADGKYGGKTHQAVLDYENAVGFAADGSAGKETQARLFSAANVITRRYALIATEIAAGRMTRDNYIAYAEEMQTAILTILTDETAKAEFARVCTLCEQAIEEQYKQIDALYAGDDVSVNEMKLAVAENWCLYVCSYWARVAETIA